MSDVSDREKFEFERDKWRAEFDVRRREASLKEKETASARWRSPLVVAIFAATVAAIGNAVVAYVNGSQQLVLEHDKAESARIFEMIKTGDEEKAAQNLRFLLKTGLISDPSRVDKLTAFLDAPRPHGTGPALPAPGGPVAFEPSAALTDSVKQSLDTLLQDYVARLDRLGLPAPERVSIRLEQTGSSPNAYYQKGMIVIDPRLAGDRSVPLREYGHHVLTSQQSRAWRGAYAAIESGLADYLACSHLDNPRFGEMTARLMALGQDYLRNMANDLNYANAAAAPDEPQQGGEVWGGAFWALRGVLERDPTDAILIAAWRDMTWPAAEAEIASAFVARLLTEVAQKAPSRRDAIRAVLKARGFPVAD
jgi:hypothetical protein